MTDATSDTTAGQEDSHDPMPTGERLANDLLDAIDSAFPDSDDYRLALESAVYVLRTMLEAS